MRAAEATEDLAAIKGKIVEKRFDDALHDLQDLLESDPDNTELLYMSAVCRRYRGEHDAAVLLLDRLKSIAPEHGRAHQEEGHNYRDMGRPDAALRAYSRACRFNPALEASWRAKQKILADHGRRAEAQQAGRQLEFLERLPRPLVAVIDLVSQGRVLKAEDLCRQYLQKVPHDVEGMRLLADIGVRLGVLDDAEFLLDCALKLEPDNVRVHMDYIQVLRKRQKFAAALEQAQRLLETAPDNPQFRSLYAIECMQTGDYEAALESFDRVLAELPGDPVTLTSRGHACKTRGDYNAAVAAYRDALASDPRHGEAYYSLANLKVYAFGDDEIRDMLAQADDPDLPFMGRVYLNFALGKAYEDRQEYATAFEHYRRGNQLKKSRSRYDAGRMSAEFRAQREVFTAAFLESRAGAGHDAPDPIFILGLPRAGSTLLEQILSSHSLVDGTLELPNILALSQRLRRRGRDGGSADYPAILREIGDPELLDFGAQYLGDTRIHRRGAPYFIDKMPNNFRHIGLIHLILPNAKIIDARRHPMACCFSAFKQLFAEGQEFTYDLADMGRYYRDYAELMDHWDEVLPGKVLRVHYEDVVADLDQEVRRLLDYCGLPFEAACIDFHRTERSVRTPSSEQVRQPIFRSGIAQWRKFEPWLAPLGEALGPALDRYPPTPDMAKKAACGE